MPPSPTWYARWMDGSAIPNDPVSVNTPRPNAGLHNSDYSASEATTLSWDLDAARAAIGSDRETTDWVNCQLTQGPTATDCTAPPATLTVATDSDEVSVADTVTANLTLSDPSLANGQPATVTVQGADDLQQDVLLGSDGTATFSYYASAEGTDTITATLGPLQSNAASVTVKVPPMPQITTSYYEKYLGNSGLFFRQGKQLGARGIKKTLSLFFRPALRTPTVVK